MDRGSPRGNLRTCNAGNGGCHGKCDTIVSPGARDAGNGSGRHGGGAQEGRGADREKRASRVRGDARDPALYARRFGAPGEAEALRGEILKLQHADGGWASVIGEEASDPLATGQALYILQQAPDDAAGAAVGAAERWLLTRQRDDGSWAIDITRVSKLDRSAPAKSKSLKDATGIYTFGECVGDDRFVARDSGGSGQRGLNGIRGRPDSGGWRRAGYRRQRPQSAVK